ncbi:MAG: hypothetical protein R6V27_10310, partial [Balneolaceae bacterium]
RESWAWAERKWSHVTEDTGVGDPSKSSNEKGERYFNDLTDKLAAFYVELCNSDLEDLYE